MSAFRSIVGRLTWSPIEAEDLKGTMLKVLMLRGCDLAQAALAKITIPAMRRYADRHLCELRVVTKTTVDRHPAWMKIPSIREALTEEFDFVLWLDADALIVRSDVDVRTAIHPTADLQLSWHGPETTDWQAPPELPPHFNAGVLLIRVSSWSKDFFARVWETGQLENAMWHDQSTMHHVLCCSNVFSLENWIHPAKSHVAHLDAAWNSIPGVATAPDPIINHYAGIEDSMRLRLLEIDCETLPYRENATGQVRSGFSRQLNAYVKEMRHLLATRGELTAMRRELTAMRDSLSWRITRPLRAGRRLVNRYRCVANQAGPGAFQR